MLKYFRQIITPTLHFNATLNCIRHQSAVGGDDINRQLMFLFTCQLRLKNVVTELSSPDIFLTAFHFAKKLLSVPMLGLCHKQRREPLCSLHQHLCVPHGFLLTGTLCLLPEATCFTRCGGIGISEGWSRVYFSLVGSKQGFFEAVLYLGSPRAGQGQEVTSSASRSCDGWWLYYSDILLGSI